MSGGNVSTIGRYLSNRTRYDPTKKLYVLVIRFSFFGTLSILVYKRNYVTLLSYNTLLAVK